VRRTISNDARG